MYHCLRIYTKHTERRIIIIIIIIIIITDADADDATSRGFETVP
jgi:hypothetical protein